VSAHLKIATVISGTCLVLVVVFRLFGMSSASNDMIDVGLGATMAVTFFMIRDHLKK
jgi:hypothetical protein